jgi:hypothetical protein
MAPPHEGNLGVEHGAHEALLGAVGHELHALLDERVIHLDLFQGHQGLLAGLLGQGDHQIDQRGGVAAFGEKGLHADLERTQDHARREHDEGDGHRAAPDHEHRGYVEKAADGAAEGDGPEDQAQPGDHADKGSDVHRKATSSRRVDRPRPRGRRR